MPSCRPPQIRAGVNHGWNGSDDSMAMKAPFDWALTLPPVNINFVNSQFSTAVSFRVPNWTTPAYFSRR